MLSQGKKILKHSLRAVLGLISLLLIASVMLLWRLKSGPIELTPLTPTIQSVVSGLPGNFEVRIKGIELAWDRQLGDLQLYATGVTLRTNEDFNIFTAPAVKISLSVAALTKRIIALSAIEVRNVEVHLVFNQDGSLNLGKKVRNDTSTRAESAEGFQDLTELFMHMIKVLESPADPEYPLSYLKTIRLKGELTAQDFRLNKEFSSREIAFEFEGLDHGIEGDLSLLIDQPEELAGVEIDISLLAKGKDVTTQIGMSGVHLSELSKLDNRLAALQGMGMTLAGSVSADMTLPLTVHSLDLELSSGPGKIAFADIVPIPINFRALSLSANANPAEGHLELTQLKLLLGDENTGRSELSLDGTVSTRDELINVAAEARLNQLKIDDIDLYWPAGLVSGTRTWLTENLKTGLVEVATLNIDMDIPSADGGAITLHKLHGDVEYSGLSVYYFRPLSPATGVTGSGTFNRQGFDLSVSNGMVEGVNIGPGRVQINGLDTKNVSLDVDTRIEGSFSDTLAVLESPPFHINEAIGLSSTQAEGELKAGFKIALPLKSGLKPEEIKYQVDARLERASIQNIFRDFSVENAELDIENDSAQLGIKGSLNIADIPVTLNLSRVRDGVDHARTSVKVVANEVRSTDVARLGYVVDQYFSGTARVEIDATVESGGDIDLEVTGDLTESDLTIPALHWTKPPGKSGSASATVTINTGHGWSIDDFKIDAGSLATRGSANYDPVNSAVSVKLGSFKWDRSVLANLDVSFNPGLGTSVKVEGGQLDLQPILFPEDKQKLADTGTLSNHTDSDSTAPMQTVSLNIGLLDRVYFSQDRFLKDFSVQLELQDAGLQLLRVHGFNPLAKGTDRLEDTEVNSSQLSAGEFSFSFGPLESVSYPLSVKIDDFGALLATTLDKHIITGGELVIEGESRGSILNAPINTNIRLENFKLIDAPIFAQVLNFASLQQTIDTMKSEGLLIDSIDGDLSLSDKTFSTEQLRAHGGTIGATIKGKLAFDPVVLDLHGSVIPLDRISGVVGKVPILKNVLVSGDEEGIVALDYAVSGSLENPEIDVQPGSLLTPGALRDIFDTDDTQQ